MLLLLSISCCSSGVACFPVKVFCKSFISPFIDGGCSKLSNAIACFIPSHCHSFWNRDFALGLCCCSDSMPSSFPKVFIALAHIGKYITCLLMKSLLGYTMLVFESLLMSTSSIATECHALPLLWIWKGYTYNSNFRLQIMKHTHTLLAYNLVSWY